jgi:hypothetical protein
MTTPIKKKASSLRGNANALKAVRQRQIDREVFDFNASPEVTNSQKRWLGADDAIKDLEQAWRWQT